MPIPIACPQCGARLKAPDDLAGQKATCPQCASAIPVPAEPEPFAFSGPPPSPGLRDAPNVAFEVVGDVRASGELVHIPSTKDERSMAMLCHLLAVFTGFPGPLILWLIKKDESRFIDYHGKEALNFSLNILAYALIAAFIVIVVSVVTCGFGLVLLPIAIAPGIYGMVMHIIACTKANNGEMYRYPATVRVIT